MTSQDLESTIRAQETAINTEAPSNPATSSATGAVGVLPDATALPAIRGVASAGALLSETPAIWANTPSSYTFQWLRCGATGADCNPIEEAGGQDYVLTAADVGSTVRVEESAANAWGFGSAAISPPTPIVVAALHRLSIVVEWKAETTKRWSEFTSLIAPSVPINTHIEVTCGGRGCPFRRHGLTVSAATKRCTTKQCRGKARSGSTAREVDLTGLVRGRRLAVKTKLEIAFILPAYIGEMQAFTIEAHGPHRHQACLAPGRDAPTGSLLTG